MQGAGVRRLNGAEGKVRAIVLAGPASLASDAAAQQPADGHSRVRRHAGAHRPRSPSTAAPRRRSPSGVIIPPGRASIWVSGTVPPVLKADAPAGSRERYGDTKTQAAGILKSIETQLTARGLTMSDVVYIRAYLVADPAKDNKIDVAGWNAAYGEVFNTAANPTKTARSTVGVAALVNSDWLIEIEAFAVYPK